MKYGSFSYSSLICLSLPPLPFSLDEPGQLKIYLPKKLLECLPKCSSLPKERHRWNTNEVRMTWTWGEYLWQWDELCVFVLRDSSLPNVTLRHEEKVNNTMAAFHYETLKHWHLEIIKQQQQPELSTKFPLTLCFFWLLLSISLGNPNPHGMRRQNQGFLVWKL